ncbi:DUF1871 family protein [Clostridium senegalense]|uniref:DUF1871 family protein n=1 Tax=Clostridium senegalense TaxID=1465809 RepID=UPI000287CF6E|nr:DUF1871 family protein [Clostridium senegalense]
MTFYNIKKIIDKWDPLGLLDTAPSDEYDYETEQIFNFIKNTDNKEIAVLANKIMKVFLFFFEDAFRNSYDECLSVAKEILLIK